MMDYFKSQGLNFARQQNTQPIILINNTDITPRKTIINYIKTILPQILESSVVNLLGAKEYHKGDA